MKHLQWEKVGGSTWAARSNVAGDEAGAFEYMLNFTVDGGFSANGSSSELLPWLGEAPFNALHSAKETCQACEERIALSMLRRNALLMLEATVDGTCEDADTRRAAAELRGALALLNDYPEPEERTCVGNPSARP